MTKPSPLDEILEHLQNWVHYTEDKPEILREQRNITKQAIKQWVREEIIGEDEPLEIHHTLDDQQRITLHPRDTIDRIVRNFHREEQRLKLEE